MTSFHSKVGALVDRILIEVGSDIVLGLPLGLGKANHIANELYARAAADPEIRLHILTAVTLEPPSGKSEIEGRFVGPLNARLFAGYPRLAYAEAVRNGTLPPNIDVYEFFLLAGRWLEAPRAQQNYISANYSDAARCLADRGLNVIAQLVAREPSGASAGFSLSCNPDMTLDLLPLLAEKRKRSEPALLVAQVNSELPFMGGDAIVPPGVFDHVFGGRCLRISAVWHASPAALRCRSCDRASLRRADP